MGAQSRSRTGKQALGPPHELRTVRVRSGFRTSTKKHMNEHYRQGDVLIVRVDKIEKREKMESENGRVVLAHGEVTGHAHAIDEAGVIQFRTDVPDVTALEISQAVSMLTHEEHGTIPLTTGTYRVVRQREYSPEEIRNVAD